MYGNILVLPLAAAAAVLAVPATASAAPALVHPQCVPTQAVGTSVEVTVADNGSNVCLVRGQRLSVTLAVNPEQYPDPANWWSGVVQSGGALSRLPNTRLPIRGTTLAEFQAVHRGTSTLTSTWSICPPDTTPSCSAPLRLWRVTVTVTSNGRRR